MGILLIVVMGEYKPYFKKVHSYFKYSLQEVWASTTPNLGISNKVKNIWFSWPNAHLASNRTHWK